MTEVLNGFGGLSGFLFWELQFRRLKRKNAVPAGNPLNPRNPFEPSVIDA
jgi:hypothetical protein